MQKINGFTLIELLIVLTILTVISLLVVPSAYKTWEKQQTKQFLALLDADIFYIQNKGLGTRDNSHILLRKDHYIVALKGQQLYERTYPKHLRFNGKESKIYFRAGGTINQPTTYQFVDDEMIYNLIFPFGKGRHYLDAY